jgi:HK97 family phage major capsid protein
MKEMITQNPLAVLALVGFVGAMLMMMLNVNGDAAATLTPPDLTGLQGEMEQCLKDMEGLQGKAEEADKAGDKDKAKQARSMYDDLVKKFDGLKGKAAAAKDQIGRIELLNELRRMNQVDAPVMPTGRPAEPVNHNLRGKAHKDAFIRYMSDGPGQLGGEQLKLLEPEDPAKAEAGMLMPRDWRDNILGLRGKADGDGILLSTDSSPANLVPENFLRQVQMLPPEPSFLMNKCMKIVSPTGTLTLPRLVQGDTTEHGGVSVTRQAEGVEYEDTEPSWEQVTIQSHQLSAQTRMSRTMLRRSGVAVEPFIQQMFRSAVGHTVDTEILTGRGSTSKECLGIQNDTAIREWKRTTADSVQYEDLVRMKYAILSHHRNNMEFVVADDAMEKLVLTKDSDGRPLYSDGVGTAPFGRLLNVPVAATQRITLGTEGDVCLGDWSQYILAIEEDILVMRSEHRHMEKGLILLVVTMHVGGRAITPRAFVRLGDTDNRS